MVLNKLRLIPALVGVLSCASFAAAQAPPAAQPLPAPVVVQAEKHDVSPALRDLPVELAAEPPVFREIPRQPLPRRGPKIRTLDPLTQTSPGPEAIPSTLQNFEGVSNAGQSLVSGFSVAPPDTNGDVGPNHYVQWVNLAYAVYDRSGKLLLGPVKGNAPWKGFGAPCETQNDGDPIVLHDRQADRWLLSQLALPNGSSGPFYQCIAVSTSPDPTGTYYRYVFKVSDTKLNDYPKFGIWPDGYYLAVNQYTCFFIFCSWAGQGTMAFERDKMLLGQPAQMVYFDLYGVDPNLGGMLPSDLDGPAPPAGSPNYFVEMDDDAWLYSPDQLQIWAFHADWKNPTTASTFTKQTALTTAPFDSNMCGYSRDCIPQPGTSSRLDAISDRLMYRLQYRNFGTYETLVTNHTVDVDGTDHAGIRWYELRKSGGVWNIHQQGTYAPDSDHRWMGSIAMDGAGNIALGFTVSSGATNPSIRYTGRLATDPLGQMTQGEATMISGAGSQTGTNRWGDYSMMAVDSTDDCTFWYTQEYYGATSDANWQTRIGSFKLLCQVTSSGSDFLIAASPSSQTVAPGASAKYTVTLSALNGYTSAVDLTVSGLPAGATATFSSNPVTPTALGVTSTLTVGTSGTTPGTYTLTITGTGTDGATTTHTTTVTLVVVPPPDFSIAASPSSQTVSRGTSATYTVTLTAFNGYASKVNLSVSGLPPGATATFSPSQVTPTGSSTLTVTTRRTTPKKAYTLTITGTGTDGATTTHKTTVTLQVQ